MFGTFVRRRFLPVLLLAFGMVLAVGCGGSKGSKDAVSGKVTLNGQAVSGEITFVASDGKEFKSPLAMDGGYSVLNVPKGEAKISVKTLGGIAPPSKDVKAEMPGMPAGGSGVAPPAKYGNPATSGLTYTVKGGEEKHDITLTP